MILSGAVHRFSLRVHVQLRSRDSEPQGHGSPSVMGGGVLAEAVQGRKSVSVGACVVFSL